MASYKVAIDGSFTLAQINAAIMGEEAGASKFLDSQVGTDEGQITNVATFDELAPGTVPPALTIVKHGSPAPPGTSQEWSGVMLVEGSMQPVVGHRKNA